MHCPSGYVFLIDAINRFARTQYNRDWTLPSNPWVVRQRANDTLNAALDAAVRQWALDETKVAVKIGGAETNQLLRSICRKNGAWPEIARRVRSDLATVLDPVAEVESVLSFVRAKLSGGLKSFAYDVGSGRKHLIDQHRWDAIGAPHMLESGATGEGRRILLLQADVDSLVAEIETREQTRKQNSKGVEAARREGGGGIAARDLRAVARRKSPASGSNSRHGPYYKHLKKLLLQWRNSDNVDHSAKYHQDGRPIAREVRKYWESKGILDRLPDLPKKSSSESALIGTIKRLKEDIENDS